MWEKLIKRRQNISEHLHEIVLVYFRFRLITTKTFVDSKVWRVFFHWNISYKSNAENYTGADFVIYHVNIMYLRRIKYFIQSVVVKT